jgi:hypothetical protein
MSTVETVLKGVRYDLRNYGDIDFDSTLLMHYLNRSIHTLDYALASHNSDWTLNTGDVTLTSGSTSVAVPTNAFNIREVWISDRRKENLDQMSIYYKLEFRTGETGEPNYWSHLGDTIIFEVAPSADTTVSVYYDKLSTELTAESDTMPYSGRFDDALREAVILLCQSKKYKQPSQADAAYAQIFQSIVQHDVVNRKFVKKNYRLDF